MYPTLHCSTAYNIRQDMETTQVVANRLMDKEEVIQICNGILLSHKKNEVGQLVEMWMDLQSVIHSKICQK